MTVVSPQAGSTGDEVAQGRQLRVEERCQHDELLDPLAVEGLLELVGQRPIQVVTDA